MGCDLGWSAVRGRQWFYPPPKWLPRLLKPSISCTQRRTWRETPSHSFGFCRGKQGALLIHAYGLTLHLGDMDLAIRLLLSLNYQPRCLLLHQQHAKNNLGKVTKIEGIMNLHKWSAVHVRITLVIILLFVHFSPEEAFSYDSGCWPCCC